MRYAPDPETRAYEAHDVPRDVLHESVAGPLITSGRAHRGSNEVVRRGVDLAVVALCAPAVVLMIGGCALLIYLLMGRPIFFVQDRVGRGGRIFSMYKLRTMINHAPVSAHATVHNDSRVTPLGRFLRLSHLDELPQLWNILKGDMTLIGPRPEQPALVQSYLDIIPAYGLRHSVAPGLTGYAQVYYGYAANVEETRIKLEYDLHYIEHRCLKLDIKILIRTLLVYSNPNYVR